MSDSDLLRKTRKNTVINQISKYQEKEIKRALVNVVEKIQKEFPKIRLNFKPTSKLSFIVKHLRKLFPDIDFHYKFDSSFISPDGGFLNLEDSEGNLYPVLISEVKNQGTNDKRQKEGLCKQSKGHAIERLGKNVIGLRAYLLNEGIFPFVCFGYGCDFAEDSSILDRVITIGMFGELNKTYLVNQGLFNRGSFYFRDSKWSVEEMTDIMYDICKRSIHYYFAKYGEDIFLEK